MKLLVTYTTGTIGVPLHMIKYIKNNYPDIFIYSIKIKLSHCEELFYQEKMISKIKKVVVRKNITHMMCIDEEVFFIAQIKDWLEKHCKILINTRELYDTLHNKYNGYKFSTANNIPTIPTMLLTNDLTKHQIETFIGKKYPAYVKSVYSTGGKGTQTYNDINELFDSHSKIKENIVDRIIQPCVKGTIYTANAIYSKGVMIDIFILKSLSFINDTKTIRMPPFCEVIRTDIFNEYMKTIGNNTGYSGMLEVEFLVNDAGKIYLMEYNPRFSGSFICATDNDASIAKNYMNILCDLPIIPFSQKEIIYSFSIVRDIQYYIKQSYQNPKTLLKLSWLKKYFNIKRKSQTVSLVISSYADCEYCI